MFAGHAGVAGQCVNVSLALPRWKVRSIIFNLIFCLYRNLCGLCLSVQVKWESSIQVESESIVRVNGKIVWDLWRVEQNFDSRVFAHSSQLSGNCGRNFWDSSGIGISGIDDYPLLRGDLFWFGMNGITFRSFYSRLQNEWSRIYADPGPIYAFLWETFGGKIVPPTKLVTGHRKSGSYAWSRLFCAWFSGSFPPRVFRFTNLRFFWKPCSIYSLIPKPE